MRRAALARLWKAISHTSPTRRQSHPNLFLLRFRPKQTNCLLPIKRLPSPVALSPLPLSPHFQMSREGSRPSKGLRETERFRGLPGESCGLSGLGPSGYKAGRPEARDFDKGPVLVPTAADLRAVGCGRTTWCLRHGGRGAEAPRPNVGGRPKP